jgi:hypothetical protein
MLLTILIVLLVFALVGGVWGWGGSAPGPYWGWSPVGLILLVLLILWLTGSLH